MRNFLILCGGASLVAAAPLAAQPPSVAEAPHHGIHRSADVEWKAGPPSLPPGAQFAVLEGDPSAEGYFALRLKLPDGYVIPPHWHPVQERVTVLSGAFHLGHGETVNREQAQRLPPGTYFSLPPRMTHYAIAEGETVVQLASMGPWQINYVNPADDPRR